MNLFVCRSQRPRPLRPRNQDWASECDLIWSVATRATFMESTDPLRCTPAMWGAGIILEQNRHKMFYIVNGAGGSSSTAEHALLVSLSDAKKSQHSPGAEGLVNTAPVRSIVGRLVVRSLQSRRLPGPLTLSEIRRIFRGAGGRACNGRCSSGCCRCWPRRNC